MEQETKQQRKTRQAREARARRRARKLFANPDEDELAGISDLETSEELIHRMKLRLGK